MSILVRFSLAVLTLILLAVLGLTGVSVESQRAALRGEALALGRTVAHDLAAASAEAMATDDPLTLVNLAVDAKSKNERVVYAALVARDGRVVGHSERSAMGRLFNLDRAQPLPDLGGDVQQAAYGDENVWDLVADVVPKGASAPVGSVHVGLSQSQVLKSIRDAVTRQLLLAAVLLAVGAGLSVFLMGLLVRPLTELAEAAGKVGGGDFSVRVPVRSRDEVGRLMERFNSMAENLEIARAERAEKERMQGELNVARRIQANLLPDKAPALSGWELVFHCAPAKELGGDFYDWFPLKGGKKLGLVIADVSGKGVPAALHMASLRNLMRFAAHSEAGPLETLKSVNLHAMPDLKGEHFVTVCYVEIDLAAHSGILVTAGHDPALLVSGQEVKPVRGKGMPIGVAEPEDFDFVLRECRFDLAPGEMLALYTDGITEAMDAQQKQFGRTALEAALKGGGDAKGTLERVLKAVHAHVGECEPSDDLTALILRRVA